MATDSPSVMRAARPKNWQVSILGLILGISLSARQGNAYCRASTCEPDGVVCETASPNDCGIPLIWQRECIGFGMQEDGTRTMAMEDATKVVRDSFAKWTHGVCGGQNLGFALVDLGTVPCDRVEYNSTKGNVNVVVFRDDVWPYEDRPDAVALTTLTFSPETGEIFDADIEVNTAKFPLSVDGTSDRYDLISVMAHEAGHVFGMGHSPQTDATMFSEVLPGSTHMRDLTDDDKRGVCSIYPPRLVDATQCNPIPRHGFADLCGSQQSKNHCSISQSCSSTSPPTLAGAMTPLFVLALGFARRKSKNSCASLRSADKLNS